MGKSRKNLAKQAGHIFNRELPLAGEYELVIAGGGPAGCGAAIAARRAGLKTLLVEGQGQLGGTGTSGLVSHWLGGRSSDCKNWIVGGIFREMAQEAAKAGFALLPQQEPNGKLSPHGWGRGQLTAGIPFDPFAMAYYLDKKMSETGVDVLLMTQAVDVSVENDRISHVIMYNKSGLQAISAEVLIDATGDADIAARSGCEIVKGRDEDGLMTPVTLEFHVDNVDQDALSEYIHTQNSPRFREKVKELRESGEWPFSYDIFISVQLNEKGTMLINTPRICEIDGTDGLSVTQGMIQGREEIQKLMEIMRKHIPGFAKAGLKTVASLLGVRETRRIIGEYVLTLDDLVNDREFPNTIGYSAYGWDLPDPKKPSYQPMSDKKVKKSTYTPIPYQIMVPQPITNLICPGRAVSVQRDVLGPLRVMAPCMAMGEAAGQAARQVIQNSIAFRDIDVEILRKELKNNGAIVDLP